MRSLQTSVFGAAGSDETRPASHAEHAPTPYYIATGGTPLYESPGKKVVAQLAEYRKVHRLRLERGYAYVRVDGSGQEGWVLNAKLIWKLPAKPSAAAAPPPTETTAPAAQEAPPSTEPADEPVSEPAVEPAQEPTEAAADDPAPVMPTTPAASADAALEPKPDTRDVAPTKVKPSVFDPY